MTELDEQFSGVDGAFKFYEDKLIYIHDFLPWEKMNPWDVMFYGLIND